MIETTKPAIMAAVDALGAVVCESRSLVQAFDDLGGDTPPAWLHVVQAHFTRLADASDALETLVRRLPWGDGGCAPHGDSDAASSGDGRVQLHQAGEASAARPDQPSSLAFN